MLYSKAGCFNLPVRYEKYKLLNRNNAYLLFVFLSGKKKTQESKNKGRKATDTKQKKTDLDSSADMRDSKEGESSQVSNCFLSHYLLQSKHKFYHV